MGHNTPYDSTLPLPQPSPQPRFEFHPKGTDCPRLEWPDWLSVVSLQLQADYPGPVGLFLASVVGGVACQARALGATDWASHERLATEEADRAAAWIAALEQEVAQPGGHWELGDDATGALDGHDDTARRFWVGPPDDQTYMN